MQCKERKDKKDNDTAVKHRGKLVCACFNMGSTLIVHVLRRKSPVGERFKINQNELVIDWFINDPEEGGS